MTKSADGFVPNSDVIGFYRAKEWNQETPERKLNASFKDLWFAKTLTTKLSFRGTIDESEAIGLLADAAAAPPEYRPQVVFLLLCLEAAGVLERDGTTVRA